MRHSRQPVRSRNGDDFVKNFDASREMAVSMDRQDPCRLMAGNFLLIPCEFISMAIRWA
jgi:hypothetical protein